MIFTDSLEKETIRLSYINQVRIGELAESLNTTPDRLVNDILRVNTFRNTQFSEDLLWLCKTRIAEIKEELKNIEVYEKPGYLSEMDKYLLMQKILEAKPVKKEVIAEDEYEE